MTELDNQILMGAAPMGLSHSAESERTVLGAVLVDPAQLPRVRRIVSASSFYASRHHRIFQAIEVIADTGAGLDVCTLRAELEATGKLDGAGGPGYLAELLEGIPRSANAVHYARTVRDHEWRRAVQARAAGILEACNGASDRDLAELIAGLAAERRPTQQIEVVDLHSPEVQPQRPEFVVNGLIRRQGLHTIWAQPGGHKTSSVLAILRSLQRRPHPATLFGHPELLVHSGLGDGLWIATEETAGGLRFRDDAVLRGMGNPELAGRIRHVFAAARPRVTLDDVPAVIQDQGPFDVLVLDSLTGLRPKVVNGQRVNWDCENDAGNEQHLALRALAAEDNIAIIIVQHSDKAGGNYRGPTDLWASSDVMAGLLPSDGRVRVWPQKNRDGRLLRQFYLSPECDGDTFRIEYDGVATADLSPNAQIVRAYMQNTPMASQAEIITATKLKRATAQRAIKECADAGIIRDTGNTDNRRSPIYARCPDEVGTNGAES